MDMGPMGTYQLWGLGEQHQGGMMLRPPEMPVSAWLYYVQVDSVQATIDAALAAGGSLVHGPHPVPGGNVAVLIDPQGGHFAVHGG
jgi:predicted enzyme related to lactoylglutathione lyase